MADVKIFVGFLFLLPLVDSNALDDYVWKNDGHCSYSQVRDWTYKSEGRTSYLLNMTSQKWPTENDTDRSLWWHFLIVHIPDEIDPELMGDGFLFIEGGSNENGEKLPDYKDPIVSFTGEMSTVSKSILADLKQIPNEHMTFKHGPKHLRRSEDAIIAYTWRRFLENPHEPEWLLRMPMTKTAVKALDHAAVLSCYRNC